MPAILVLAVIGLMLPAVRALADDDGPERERIAWFDACVAGHLHDRAPCHEALAQEQGRQPPDLSAEARMEALGPSLMPPFLVSLAAAQAASPDPLDRSIGLALEEAAASFVGNPAVHARARDLLHDAWDHAPALEHLLGRFGRAFDTDTRERMAERLMALDGFSLAGLGVLEAVSPQRHRQWLELARRPGATEAAIREQLLLEAGIPMDPPVGWRSRREGSARVD